MTLFFTFWVIAAQAFMVGSVITLGHSEWCRGGDEGLERRVGYVIIVFAFTVPALYELGWVALPMALGR